MPKTQVKFKALGNQVIVCLNEKEEPKTSGGLYLPEGTAKGEEVRTPIANVVAVGPYVEDVQIGDKVLLPKLTTNLSTGQTAYIPNRGGTKIVHDGVEYLAFLEDQLIVMLLTDEDIDPSPFN